MQKVGILRGPSLNPYEAQYFKRLPSYGFEPIGISTPDNAYDFKEIPYPVRVGNTFKTATNNRFRYVLGVTRKITKYNTNSYNFRIYNLKKLTEDLDLIHSADTWYPYTMQAVKTGKPTVVTEWENIPFNHEEKPYAQIKRYNHQHVNHFIAITEKAKELLVKEGADANKITVIPAGLDCETFKPTEKDAALMQKLEVSKDAIKILFVGRFVEEKGIFDLLSAFSKINTKNIQLLVVGAGTPETTTQIHKLAQDLNLQSIVKFLGSINYTEMPKIHNIADIFCLPSADTKFWAEQFGYSIVEAMACGKPAVSTYSGSIPEIVKDQSTGLLVEQHNPTALATALEKLVNDQQLREKYGTTARKWVVEKFEAEKIAKQIANVYQKVLS